MEVIVKDRPDRRLEATALADLRGNRENTAPDTASIACMTESIPKSSRFLDVQGPIAMHRGGQLPGARMAFETWGELNEDASNALLILTGLSPSAHAAATSEDSDPGWWDGMVGPGLALDSDRFFIICVNSLGSCKGSTGPASINPDSGQPWRLDFPELAIEDIAASAREVVRFLGISRLAGIVGPSMGGMSAMAYAIQFPDEVDSLLILSSAAHSRPQATAIRSLQREMIRADRGWQGGEYDPEHPPIVGMGLARKLGMISYRSAAEWNDRFGRERMAQPPEAPFAPEFEIESYLQAHAEKFVGSFDPNCYLYLSRAMDWFDILDYGSDIADAFSACGVKRALVIGVESDLLFPEPQQRELAQGLSKGGIQCQYRALPSLQGHDSFLVDIEGFSAPVRDFLSEL